MNLRPAAVLAIVPLGLVPAACGSSQSKTVSNASATASTSAPGSERFSVAGMALHFTFPAKFRIITLAPSKSLAGNTAHSSHAAVGIGNHDLLVMTRFRLKIPVTAGNLAGLRGAFDALISSAFSRQMSSTVTSAGGLPALSYRPVPVVGLGVPATSRVTLVFFGQDEYELNCQYTRAAQASVTAACDEMLATLSTAK